MSGSDPAGELAAALAVEPAQTEARVYRVMALGFLPATVVFGLLTMPLILAQWSQFVTGWSLAAAVGVLAAPAAMGLTSFIAPIRVVRTLAAIAVAFTIASQATLPFAALTRTGQTPWIQQMLAVGVIAGPIAWRPIASMGLVALAAVLTTVDRLALGATVLEGTQDGLYVLLFCATFVTLAANAVSFSRAVDRTAAVAIEASSTAAVQQAREREQARINALVHDRVLATLLLAARGGAQPAETTRHDAAAALEGLSALLDAESGTDLAARDFVFGVQAVTTELAPEAGFGYEVADDPMRVPFDVAEALTQAVEEALRNVQRHAGPTANCTVHVRVEPRGVLVDVLDDGRGFARADVPPDRLGIARSIEGRMRAIDGGEATVVSEPRVGTRVLLRYHRPEPA